MVLPYQGQKGESVMKQLTNTIRKTLPNTATRVTYKGTKLSTKFNTKDREKFEHVHNIVYEAKCPDCPANYIGETNRRLVERIKEHAKKDKNSHLLRHAQLSGHKAVSLNDFQVLSKNFRNYYSRKISETILIKQKHTIIK